MNNTKDTYTQKIKTKAIELGFISCGISKAQKLEDQEDRLAKWLHHGMHGEMSYMENHFEKRLDPTLLVPGTKSVISLIYNYYPRKNQTADTYKIAKYAYGKDYHYVIKDKLKELYNFIDQHITPINGRAFVDSAPILEKAWASRSGLGWIGKNTNLITPQKGSFYFIADLLIDLELNEDQPIKDYCGSCTKCIDSCPTDALTPYHIDASKCISYFTIELKGEIPSQFSKQYKDWIFGCDICQDVCPWNRFSKPHHEEMFYPNEHLLDLKRNDWEELTQETFQSIFKKTAVKRTKYLGLIRNINYVKKKREA